MALNYFELSTEKDAERPALISEARFVELRETAERFDVFLWVDGPEAMCGRRDVRQLGVGGPFEWATTKRCPGRRGGDGDLRAASARLLLAVAKAGTWITPTAAFHVGNPEAAPPTAKNAFVTFAKGRQLLDFERGHEVWESFELQRKHHGALEPLVRFRPGKAAAERLGVNAVDLRWCVAWSEPSAVADSTANGQARDGGSRFAGDLPVWDDQRAPQVEHVRELEIIIRDAVVNRAREEFVLLLDISDPFEGGPYVIEAIGLAHRSGDGTVSMRCTESAHPGARIAVPGRQVRRLRTMRQAVARDDVIQWACVAIRYERMPVKAGVAEVEHEVVVRVRALDAVAVERHFNVRFRVVNPGG